MPRRKTGSAVFDAAVDRMLALYNAGHRVVVSFSGGKDSGIALEVCLVAARLAGRLPVEVVMRDEEVMFPGTFEYCERVAARDEVDFRWFYACQPIVNIFDRRMPFYWVFDPQLPPESWARRPPTFAERIPQRNIDQMVTPANFPPADGRRLYAVIGLRTAESMGRLMGLHSSGGYLTRKPSRHGTYYCRPIYDWHDGDVWRAIRENSWDYNAAYDALHRLGMARNQLRIAPPAMMPAGLNALKFAYQAWPQWFDRAARRLPGLRTGAMFGARAIQPQRRLGESWKECYQRTCIDEAPAWIAERSEVVKAALLSVHRSHATTEFPEVSPCYHCKAIYGSWRNLAHIMYTGDPFCIKMKHYLRYVEPEFFRPGDGTWGGTPNFA